MRNRYLISLRQSENALGGIMAKRNGVTFYTAEDLITPKGDNGCARALCYTALGRLHPPFGGIKAPKISKRML